MRCAEPSLSPLSPRVGPLRTDGSGVYGNEPNRTEPNKQGSGKTKCLLIGINYIGQQGQLNGCHNDVDMMKKYITTHVREDETGRQAGRHGGWAGRYANCFLLAVMAGVFCSKSPFVWSTC